MLFITRKRGQRVYIGDDIFIEIRDIQNENRVSLGIQAPADVSIMREEIKEIKDEDK